MALEGTSNNTPDPPQEDPEDSGDGRDENVIHSAMRRLERDNYFRDVLGIALSYGGQAEDAAELVRALSGVPVQISQVRHRMRHGHQKDSYAEYLLNRDEVDEAERQDALDAVIPYLAMHRPAKLWRHHQPAAAVAYTVLLGKPSVRVFAKAMAEYFQNPNAVEAIRGHYQAALKEPGGIDTLMTELEVRAGAENINDTKDFAEALLREATTVRDKRLHHRADFMQIPELRAKIADMLVAGAKREAILDEIRSHDPNLTASESTISGLLYRYKKYPARVLERVRRGTEAENAPLEAGIPAEGGFTEEFANMPFWQRNPKSSLAIARLIGLGAGARKIIDVLNAYYPRHSIPAEVLSAALVSGRSRIRLMNTLDQVGGWSARSAEEKADIESLAQNFLGLSREPRAKTALRNQFALEPTSESAAHSPYEKKFQEILSILNRATRGESAFEDEEQIAKALRAAAQVLDGTARTNGNGNGVVSIQGGARKSHLPSKTPDKMIPFVTLTVNLTYVHEEKDRSLRFTIARRIAQALATNNPKTLPQPDRDLLSALARHKAERVEVIVRDNYRTGNPSGNLYVTGNFLVAAAMRKRKR